MAAAGLAAAPCSCAITGDRFSIASSRLRPAHSPAGSPPQTPRRTPEEHRARAGTGELPRTLGVFDMVFLGLGSIIGAGVFVLSGVAANELAGPAVVLGYCVAATAALLSA